mmetsp:Transcript_64612/g.151855  ORF Transcript_64612/g.151855 Transcript_64612/m.151855 type:complete len:80 (+) Transcript_64612:341-580(+)
MFVVIAEVAHQKKGLVALLFAPAAVLAVVQLAIAAAWAHLQCSFILELQPKPKHFSPKHGLWWARCPGLERKSQGLSKM